MQVLHAPAAWSAVFDDPNLVSSAGLAPLVALAARAGLAELATSRVRVRGEQGANPGLKVPALVAGMVAGADSISDMDLLRHGGMGRLFSGVRAPSTLGIFLRAFTFGHVRQLDAVASGFLPRLAGQAPILVGAEQMVWVDVDDTVVQTYGYAKQAAARGYSGVKGLNVLVATASTPQAAPVIAATRLRRGNARSSRGAATLVLEALRVTRRCGASGLAMVDRRRRDGGRTPARPKGRVGVADWEAVSRAPDSHERGEPAHTPAKTSHLRMFGPDQHMLDAVTYRRRCGRLVTHVSAVFDLNQSVEIHHRIQRPGRRCQVHSSATGR